MAPTTPGASALPQLTEIALSVAQEAASLALEGFRKSIEVRDKDHSDPVTEYDFKSERLLRKRLAERTPEIAFVGEEEGGKQGAGLSWHCDPIDGTINFVHGLPFWCVSVGLMAAGEPLAGAVVAPALNQWWSGYRGGPALRTGRPIQVSSETRLSHALIATGFPRDRSRAPDNNIDSAGRVLKAAQGLRRCGAAALDACMVADATFDGYWERKLHTWDVAAGAAIALAAGARLSSLDGGQADLSRGNILLTNGKIHDQLLALLSSAT